jgi:hypothetical protein
MLRSAITAFGITLGTVLASGSAYATVTTEATLDFFTPNGSFSCGTDCSGRVDPSHPIVSAVAVANPGMDVSVSDSEKFSVHIVTGSSPTDVIVNWAIDLSISFTDPLTASGSYIYRAPNEDGGCSYPPGGQISGPNISCAVGDIGEYQIPVSAEMNVTEEIDASVTARAAEVPEPSSLGIVILALVTFGWLHQDAKRKCRR